MSTMPTGFRYALFDLDGTLHDSAACVVAATRAAFRSFDLVPPVEAHVRQCLGIPVERSFQEMAAPGQQDRDWRPVIAAFRARYVEMAPTRVRAFPRVIEVLADLRREGITMVIVTSKKRSIAETDCAATGIVLQPAADGVRCAGRSIA